MPVDWISQYNTLRGFFFWYTSMCFSKSRPKYDNTRILLYKFENQFPLNRLVERPFKFVDETNRHNAPSSSNGQSSQNVMTCIINFRLVYVASLVTLLDGGLIQLMVIIFLLEEFQRYLKRVCERKFHAYDIRISRLIGLYQVPNYQCFAAK